MAAGAQEDRLSDLPDGVLGHLLSFLGAKEAARAAVLSRRYRHAFACVHTLSFVQEETSSSSSALLSYDSYEFDEEEQRRNAEFVALVDAAVSCYRRCGGEPGLRAFRVVFDAFHHSLTCHVDRWLSAAARNGSGAVEETTVDARRDERGICARERPDSYYWISPYGDSRSKELKDESDGEDSDDFRDNRTRDRAYRVPRWLYSSSAAAGGLRTLCLGSCFLDLPQNDAKLHLPSVETLSLTSIPDSGRDIQRLVSSCGRLADLTLDSCRRVRGLDVLDKRLRRLVLRCCHGARLAVDASDLRALEYKGPVPDESVLSFAGVAPPPALSFCDIEFCGTKASDAAELANLPGFLGWIAAATWLKLGSSCLGAGIDRSNPSTTFTQLLCVRLLELKGTLSSTSDSVAAIAAVTRILELTPNVEVLTLLILPDVDELPRYQPEVDCDPRVSLDVVPDVPPPAIPCLRDRVREINVVHYQGRVEQRTLLKMLLGAAAALEELYVAFPAGKFKVQSMLMAEIKRWVMDRPVKLMFL